MPKTENTIQYRSKSISNLGGKDENIFENKENDKTCNDTKITFRRRSHSVGRIDVLNANRRADLIQKTIQAEKIPGNAEDYLNLSIEDSMDKAELLKAPFDQKPHLEDGRKIPIDQKSLLEDGKRKSLLGRECFGMSSPSNFSKFFIYISSA